MVCLIKIYRKTSKKRGVKLQIIPPDLHQYSSTGSNFHDPTLSWIYPRVGFICNQHGYTWTSCIINFVPLLSIGWAALMVYYTRTTWSIRSTLERKMFFWTLFTPGFLKTGLAKKSTPSTLWQFIQRPIKSFYLTSGSNLVVPRSISTGPNLKWCKFQNMYSVIWLHEDSKRCHLI